MSRYSFKFSALTKWGVSAGTVVKVDTRAYSRPTADFIANDVLYAACVSLRAGRVGNLTLLGASEL